MDGKTGSLKMSRGIDLGTYAALGAAFVVLAGTASTAWAQAPAPGATQAAPAVEELQEVIVTAEKRETAASKTPIAMDVFTSQQIQEQGIHDIGSLSQVDPALQFGNGVTANAFLTLRGVSSRDASEIGDPAVPVGIDGFFMDRLYNLNQSIYDLDRVEVLRGPQGTLYGRNAIGGVVNFYTKRPTKDYEGYASVDFGNYDTVNTEGAVNAPVSDKVQIRASWGTYSHSGYFYQPLANAHYGDDDSKSARLSVAFEPVDGFTGLIYGQYLSVGGNGPGFQLYPFAFNTAGTDISHTTPAGIGPRISYGLEPFSLNIRDFRLHWEFNVTKLPWDMALTYLGGYDDTVFTQFEDLDNLSSGKRANFGGKNSPKTQNHELRLASAADQRLTWQGGLFYFNETNAIDGAYSVAGSAGTLVPAYVFPYPSVTSDSYAAYGQAGFKIVPELNLSLGARETFDDKSRAGTAYLTPAFIGKTGTIPIRYIPEYGTGHWSKFTWHAGLEWTPTDDMLAYGKVDTGYKAGGFNSTGTQASVPYGPETATNYELGIKQALLDNRMRVSGAVFYDDYKGYQASLGTCPTCTNTGVAGIQNAGNAVMKGVEGEITALVNPIGKFNFSADYLSAVFKKFDATLQEYAANGSSTVVPANLAGNTLIQSPRWSLGAGLEHNWNLPNDAGLMARVQTSFRTAQYFSNYDFADSRQGNYTVSDAMLVYTAPNDRYEVQGYVHNLENSTYITFAGETGTVHGYEYSFGAPRTFGVKATVKFKD
jgi:iron complex outermembrane recepter protein